MLGLSMERHHAAYPHDPDDLNRCLLLLNLIPEWAPRIREMAQHSQEWAALVSSWESSPTFSCKKLGWTGNAAAEPRNLRGDATPTG